MPLYWPTKTVRSTSSDEPKTIDFVSLLQAPIVPTNLLMTEGKNLGFEPTEYANLVGFDSDWRDTWWNQDYLELIARRLGFTTARRVLDIGCGVGHWGQRLSTLLDDGAEITGIDHEAEFLKTAQARTHGRPHHFHYLTARADALPFPDDHFDLVTGQTVLMHMREVDPVIHEIIRVTRPDGLVLFAEPNNVTASLSHRFATPDLSPATLTQVFEFEVVCRRGHRSLGHGDNAIGEYLPGVFAKAGLKNIQVASSDRCITLLPPYETPAQRMHIDGVREWIEKSMVDLGSKDDIREVYLHGGGQAADFDHVYALVMDTHRAMLSAIDAGHFYSSGGFMLYLVSGRK